MITTILVIVSDVNHCKTPDSELQINTFDHIGCKVLDYTPTKVVFYNEDMQLR